MGKKYMARYDEIDIRFGISENVEKAWHALRLQENPIKDLRRVNEQGQQYKVAKRDLATYNGGSGFTRGQIAAIITIINSTTRHKENKYAITSPLQFLEWAYSDAHRTFNDTGLVEGDLHDLLLRKTVETAEKNSITELETLANNIKLIKALAEEAKTNVLKKSEMDASPIEPIVVTKEPDESRKARIAGMSNDLQTQIKNLFPESTNTAGTDPVVLEIVNFFTGKKTETTEKNATKPSSKEATSSAMGDRK